MLRRVGELISELSDISDDNTDLDSAREFASQLGISLHRYVTDPAHGKRGKREMP